jgi:hypothetical protein
MKILTATSVIAALVLGAAGLQGCGGGTTTKTAIDTTTTGQQLVDLKRAYDQGIITQSEYERKKREILSR